MFDRSVGTFLWNPLSLGRPAYQGLIICVATIGLITSIASRQLTAAEGIDKIIQTQTSSRFPWPLKGEIISNYGKNGGIHNDGINIAVPEGSLIRSISSGIVAYSGNELRGYGNLILLKHANGLISAYAFNLENLVNRGDSVEQGQPIAKSGEAQGIAQLHFEIRRGKAVEAIEIANEISKGRRSTRRLGEIIF